MTALTAKVPAVPDHAEAREELARIFAGGASHGIVRAEIVSSWRQSIAYGVPPSGVVPPLHVFHADSDLLRSAQPVLDRLGDDLSNTQTSAVLSDSDMTVVARRASDDEQRRLLDELRLRPGYGWRLESTGTTALAVASQRHKPAIVEGAEHFLDALTELTTASAPITEPRTGRFLGAVTLICPARLTNALLLPLARRTATDVEHHLLNAGSARDRELQMQVLRARRRVRTPIAVVGERMLFVNAPASYLLEQWDRPRLWALAVAAVAAGELDTEVFRPRPGLPLVAGVEAIFDGHEVIGAVLRLRVVHDESEPREERPCGRRRRTSPRSGWASLTESERRLAQLVAEGMTNKQAATRLFVSHHTVDAHLRHIFAKLGLNSRVELARVVATHLAGAPMADRVVA
jgi:DNA-binding CsgD family transcriptional regulator